ncbi:MAG: hypothetical protein NTAFB01_01350 [Nitrospira sp.]
MPRPEYRISLRRRWFLQECTDRLNPIIARETKLLTGLQPPMVKFETVRSDAEQHQAVGNPHVGIRRNQAFALVSQTKFPGAQLSGLIF